MTRRILATRVTTVSRPRPRPRCRAAPPLSKITNTGTTKDVWYEYACGNEPDGDGFAPCDVAGNHQEEDTGLPNPDRDGEHLRCARCGVICRCGDLAIVGGAA